MIYLDTHIIVWMYDNDKFIFPKTVLSVMEENDLFICPIVLLELQYLREINRISTEPSLIINTLKSSVNLQISKVSFENIVNASLSQTWTRDPFNRMIVGAASLNDNILVTKDAKILENYSNAFWK